MSAICPELPTIMNMGSMGSRRCVVVGAGILGASVAARLAAAGLRVTLLDQDQPGRATSRWSFAWLNSNDKAPRPAVDLHTPEPELRRWADELLRRAWRAVRGLDDARVVELKVCVRPLPADGQSIVGRLPGADGLYVAVTHSGVTLAAHLSRLITTDLTTGTPSAPLTLYTPARFTSDIQ
jgi:glycine/D-amino acid oxidase-like deaminating enzyme